MSWTAIVLAGSRPGRDSFAEQFGTDLKALIPLAGQPMVERPVQALLKSDNVGKIIVLSQFPQRIEAVLGADSRISFRRSRGTIAETMRELADDCALDWPLLVTTADHGLLDPATINEFCSQAEESDVAIGVVERANLLRRFPQSRRTWLKFRGGAYTGANLFALRSPVVAPAIEGWRSIEQDRKKGWRIVSTLGPAVLLGVGLGLITIDQVLAHLGRRLGLSIKAVRLTNPLAGVDVDKMEDHALAENVLAGRI